MILYLLKIMNFQIKEYKNSLENNFIDRILIDIACIKSGIFKDNFVTKFAYNDWFTWSYRYSILTSMNLDGKAPSTRLSD